MTSLVLNNWALEASTQPFWLDHQVPGYNPARSEVQLMSLVQWQEVQIFFLLE